ncbi:DUF1993 domain-containing protein [Labrys okinawensis]|uniref:DUF1993 domain-containing protein n=1 Tax=Labrys okinawensis TaxID=346911 RepID=UPI0039BD3192
MPLSFYQASAQVFVHALGNLSAILEKGALYAESRKIDPVVMCGLRLTADMLPLSRQVSTACDSAKLAVSRLSGVEAPKHADEEKDFVELQSRIAKTLDYIRSVPEASVEAAAGRKVSLKLGGEPREFEPEAYLTLFALPNFYFHVTTTYAILRANGVELSKRDYLGAILG